METTPSFSSYYHAARTQVVISGVLLFFLEIFDWQLPVKVAWLDVDKLGTEELKLIASVVLVYSLFRLLVEWYQTDIKRRAFFPSKLEVFTITGFGFVVLFLYVFPENAYKLIAQLPLPLTFLLLGYGLIFGIATSVVIQNIPLIRSKDEALRLGLHRLPVVTRSSFRLFLLIASISILIIFFADEFENPLDSIWPYLVFGPVVLLAMGGLWETYFSRARTVEGELLRDVKHRHMRKAVDQHDTYYQLGGWDNIAQVQHTQLAIAAKVGDVTKVEYLLDMGEDPNQVTHLGWTPLMLAVAEGQSNIVDTLVEAGADVNAINLAGRTSLMFACRYGFKDIAAKLLEHGANPEIMPELSEPNALMVAAEFGHEEIVRLLLEHGANPKVRGEDGRAAIDYAQISGNGKIAKLLRKNSK